MGEEDIFGLCILHIMPLSTFHNLAIIWEESPNLFPTEAMQRKMDISEVSLH